MAWGARISTPVVAVVELLRRQALGVVRLAQHAPRVEARRVAREEVHLPGVRARRPGDGLEHGAAVRQRRLLAAHAVYVARLPLVEAVVQVRVRAALVLGPGRAEVPGQQEFVAAREEAHLTI